MLVQKFEIYFCNGKFPFRIKLFHILFRPCFAKETFPHGEAKRLGGALE